MPSITATREDQWSGGILMNSPRRSALGESDAWPRWWGLARHRMVLVALAPVLGADALLRPGSRWWEWLAFAVTIAGAAPGPGSSSWGQWSAIHLRFLVRRRVRWISLESDGDALVVGARGSQRVWCYEFAHRGRLDLSQRDVVLASRLARMVESFAAGGEHTHVALHVDTGKESGAEARTTLSVNVAAPTPSEWRVRSNVGIPRSLSIGRTAVLERRHYVRTPQCVLRTLRVSDFAAGRAQVALEVLGEYGSGVALSLHAGVVPISRARRLTARAVHRVGTDAEFARGAGFRWSARDQKGLDALREREDSVAQGAALCQWALYVVVSAESVRELGARVRETCDVARAAGMRLDLGVGVQGQWFTWQLPGGPGW